MRQLGRIRHTNCRTVTVRSKDVRTFRVTTVKIHVNESVAYSPAQKQFISYGVSNIFTLGQVTEKRISDALFTLSIQRDRPQQAVLTQIRRRILRRLVRVYTTVEPRYLELAYSNYRLSRSENLVPVLT